MYLAEHGENNIQTGSDVGGGVLIIGGALTPIDMSGEKLLQDKKRLVLPPYELRCGFLAVLVEVAGVQSGILPSSPWRSFELQAKCCAT